MIKNVMFGHVVLYYLLCYVDILHLMDNHNKNYIKEFKLVYILLMVYIKNDY